MAKPPTDVNDWWLCVAFFMVSFFPDNQDVAATSGKSFGETLEISGVFPGALMQVRFGECVLDSDTRQLAVRGEAVHLSPKAFNFWIRLSLGSGF